jgi:hypothetical protein
LVSSSKMPLSLRCWTVWVWFLCNAETSDAKIAWHYGPSPRFDELKSFDIIVVDPDHGFDPNAGRTARSELFAYVSVGETHRSRPYADAMNPAWFMGENTVWGSRIVDQADLAWHRFFLERILGPLWNRGYRGFFLDALDSYRLAAHTEAARQRQEDGLVAVIEAVKMRYPEARLILNRGFEIVPRVHQHLIAVAAESLFRGYNAAIGQYVKVRAADRNWLTAQLKRIKHEYLLPVYAIDYAPPTERELARGIAAKIAALGITPYVTDAHLMTSGVTLIPS